MGGHPKFKAHKQGHKKVSKSRDNWERLNMFKAAEVKKKQEK